jgi:hypothetical protein
MGEKIQKKRSVLTTSMVMKGLPVNRSAELLPGSMERKRFAPSGSSALPGFKGSKRELLFR